MSDETDTVPRVPKNWQDRPLEWVAHVPACSDCRRYKALIASGRLRLVPADAVVIPRDAIPDDLPGDLLEMAEEVSECRRVLGDHDRLVTAARLLSGGATEGDER